nr:hypothetical protein [Legionella jordanis]
MDVKLRIYKDRTALAKLIAQMNQQDYQLLEAMLPVGSKNIQKAEPSCKSAYNKLIAIVAPMQSIPLRYQVFGIPVKVRLK